MRTVGEAAALLLVIAATAASGCKKAGNSGSTTGAVIKVDGSSTVFPISQAVAEDFEDAGHGRVTIGVSGTGGGMNKFCRGETAITGASRPISTTEHERCKSAGIEFLELPVAYDGIVVAVHRDNAWAASLTVRELGATWSAAAQGRVQRWSDVRSGFPETKLQLFGPGIASGTYDYFTKAVIGHESSSRGDYTSSEDDNVLVKGVSSDKGGLGYFGYAYYAENTGRLRAVPIDDGRADNGDGPVAPSPVTVANGTYQPLSRPLFIYVNKKMFDARPEIQRFVAFYLDNVTRLVPEVNYVALPARALELVKARLAARTTGGEYAGGIKIGVSVEDLLAKPSNP